MNREKLEKLSAFVTWRPPFSSEEEKKPPTYVAKKIQWLLDGRDIYDWSVEDGD